MSVINDKYTQALGFHPWLNTTNNVKKFESPLEGHTVSRARASLAMVGAITTLALSIILGCTLHSCVGLALSLSAGAVSLALFTYGSIGLEKAKKAEGDLANVMLEFLRDSLNNPYDLTKPEQAIQLHSEWDHIDHAKALIKKCLSLSCGDNAYLKLRLLEKIDTLCTHSEHKHNRAIEQAINEIQTEMPMPIRYQVLSGCESGNDGMSHHYVQKFVAHDILQSVIASSQPLDFESDSESDIGERRLYQITKLINENKAFSECTDTNKHRVLFELNRLCNQELKQNPNNTDILTLKNIINNMVKDGLYVQKVVAYDILQSVIHSPQPKLYLGETRIDQITKLIKEHEGFSEYTNDNKYHVLVELNRLCVQEHKQDPHNADVLEIRKIIKDMIAEMTSKSGRVVPTQNVAEYLNNSDRIGDDFEHSFSDSITISSLNDSNIEKILDSLKNKLDEPYSKDKEHPLHLANLNPKQEVNYMKEEIKKILNSSCGEDRQSQYELLDMLQHRVTENQEDYFYYTSILSAVLALKGELSNE